LVLVIPPAVELPEDPVPEDPEDPSPVVDVAAVIVRAVEFPAAFVIV
jgi:hypothetical protein